MSKAKPQKTRIEESLGKSDAVTVDEASRASAVIEKATIADPVLRNEMNAEPSWQSGVVWTGSLGVLSAIGTILVQVGRHGGDFAQYDFELLSGAVTSLFLAGGVLYRRLMPGLKPLFWRWTG